MAAIEDFIRRLPIAALHPCLEGAVHPAALVELSARHPPRRGTPLKRLLMRAA